MNSSSTAPQRIDNLTGVRAFAAVWVVAVHVNLLGFPTQEIHGKLGTLINHGPIAVDIFFVLSGLVLSMVYAGVAPARFTAEWYKRFIGRRFAKVYPLHFLTFALAAAMVVIGRRFGHFPFGTEQEDTLWSAICNVLMLHGLGARMAVDWNGVSWSLGAEWFAYTVLFAPIVFGLRRVQVRWVLLSTAALWAGLFVCYVVFHAYEPNQHAGSRVLRITPEFLGGYALYRWIQARPPQRGDLWTFAGLISLLVLLYSPLPALVLLLPVVLVLLLGAYRGGRWTDRLFGNRAAVLTGEASYSIYMVHMFVVIAARSLLGRTHLVLGGPSKAAFDLIELCLAIALGFASFRYFEEPLRQRLVRAFSAQRRNPEATSAPALPGLARDTEVSATIS